MTGSSSVSLQCLSAVSPMRTGMVGVYASNGAFLSPVPFGGESYADRHALSRTLAGSGFGLQCLSAVSPMRTKETLKGWTEDRAKSPVPFGGESYADCRDEKYVEMGWNGLQCLSAVSPMRTEVKVGASDWKSLPVSSAFRR